MKSLEHINIKQQQKLKQINIMKQITQLHNHQRRWRRRRKKKPDKNY